MNLLQRILLPTLLIGFPAFASAQAAPSAPVQAAPKTVKLPPAVWRDPSPHKVQMVTVDKDVRLEVLDWGGSGRNVVLLAGLGNTAHIFDNFAPKLAQQFHVYGITRRGFGQSSAPTAGYTAQQLGDDVVAVLDAMKIADPVLVGHSIGGEELSSVATHHPGRVAGLVYLDAGYSYAFYDKEHGDYLLDLGEVTRKMDHLQKNPFDAPQIKALAAILPRFERNLEEMQNRGGSAGGHGPTAADLKSFPAMQSYMAGVVGGVPPESELHQTFEETPTGGVGKPRGQSSVSQAILAGGEKFTEIHVPTLAIFVAPHERGSDRTENPAKLAAAQASEKASTEKQAAAFQKGAPQAKVVILPKQNHYVFISDEDEVLGLISKFVNGLPPGPSSPKS